MAPDIDAVAPPNIGIDSNGGRFDAGVRSCATVGLGRPRTFGIYALAPSNIGIILNRAVSTPELQP